MVRQAELKTDLMVLLMLQKHTTHFDNDDVFCPVMKQVELKADIDHVKDFFCKDDASDDDDDDDTDDESYQW